MTKRYFPDSMPPPMVDGTTLPWWQAAAEHRLMVQQCLSCQRYRLPPAPICSQCHSTESRWKEVPGLGEVYTYTLVHRPIAGGQELPFAIAVVALDDTGGLRMISNLVDVEPDQVGIGMPVELVWEDMGPELAVPRFRPRKH